MSDAVVLRPGDAVAWWGDGAMRFAIVVAEEKGRLVIVTEEGREQRIPPGRVDGVLGAGPVPERTPEGRKEAARRAAEVGGDVRRRAEGVEVAALWELAHDLGEADDRSLAGLALAGGSAASAIAALSAALLEDGLHFVRRQDRWVPRSAEQVADLRHQREAERRRAEERALARERLAAAARGETVTFGAGEAERRWLRALEEVAIYGADAGESARVAAAEALEASGLAHDRSPEGAFRLLRRLRIFDSDDENLAIVRYGLRTEFPEDVRAAAVSVEPRAAGGRIDLTALPVITIDGIRTREIDDGLSVEALPGGGFRVGIHIADASAFVPAGGPVDREAYARGVTHYFPDRRLPMLPETISEAAASLVEGEDRPALSFLVEVGPDGAIGEATVARSTVRVRARLDYDRADAVLESGSGPVARDLEALLEVASRLEATRLAAGAARIRALEAEIVLEPDGRLVVERRDSSSPAHRLVSEAMVLAGTVAARWCRARSLPAIHRRQAPPDPARPLPTGVPDAVVARAMRRRMRRAEIGTAPGPHAGLGVAAYVQVTSPLRRYQDLAMHRQIAAVAAGGEAPYDEATLREIAATTEAAEARGRTAERERDRYWMLRYLEAATGSTVDAVVVESEPRVVVQLKETLVEEGVPALAGATLGAEVRLTIVRVNPRADVLVLRPN